MAPLSLADVWTVARNGTEDFVSIQGAIDAALDGDTILVTRTDIDMWSDTPVIDGKGLTIVAFDEERLAMGNLVVRNLGPGQVFVLSGFQILDRYGLSTLNAANPTTAGLLLENNSGSIRLQDCLIFGNHGRGNAFSGDGFDAIDVRSSQDVALVHCEGTGGLAVEDYSRGAFGLVTRNSMVAAYGSIFEGSSAGYSGVPAGPNVPGGRGGDGARIHGGAAYFAECALSAGYGGLGQSFGYSSDGGDGGNGLSLLNGAVMHDVSTTFAFGSGSPAGGGGADGVDGVEVRGPHSVVASRLPTLSGPAGFAMGCSTIDLRVTGEAGALAQLLLARRTGLTQLAPERGIQHSLAPRRIQLGPIPANGELVVPFTLPPVASGARLIHMQVEVQQGAAPSRFSNPYSLTSLDDQQGPDCGGRVYVNVHAAPGGDGRYWATAYSDLHAALGAQPRCPDEPIEVWVAQGTYKPTGPGGDRHLSFRLAGGVHLYGGFVGTETRLAQREPSVHRVILSGDLDSDDLPDFQNRLDNSEHVVETGTGFLRSRNVRVDGVTITRGDASQSSSPQENSEYGGAGLRSRCDGLILARCTIENNRARFGRDGGGVLQYDSGATLVVECVFQGNKVTDFNSGGGLYIDGGFPESAASVVHCLFLGNEATYRGGGLRLDVTDCAIKGTTVYGNHSSSSAGGVSVTVGMLLEVDNSLFWGNTAPQSNLFRNNFFVHSAWHGMRYSSVEGLTTFGDGTNSGAYPDFVDPVGPDGMIGTSDDDLRLSDSSPYVDAGSNSLVPMDLGDLDGDGDRDELTPTDLDHLRRFHDDLAVPDTGDGIAPIVDLGAYEHRGP